MTLSVVIPSPTETNASTAERWTAAAALRLADLAHPSQHDQRMAKYATSQNKNPTIP